MYLFFSGILIPTVCIYMFVEILAGFAHACHFTIIISSSFSTLFAPNGVVKIITPSLGLQALNLIGFYPGKPRTAPLAELSLNNQLNIL